MIDKKFIEKLLYPIEAKLNEVVTISEFSLNDLIDMSETIERVIGFLFNADKEEEIGRDRLNTLYNFKISIDDTINNEIDNIFK